MKLEVFIGGLKIEKVESIVFPTEERPLWVITHDKGKMVCASKGAPVDLRIIES